MDFTAALNRLIEAIEDRDHDTAKEACADLQKWCDNGGFIPPIMPDAMSFILGTLYDFLD